MQLCIATTGKTSSPYSVRTHNGLYGELIIRKREQTYTPYGEKYVDGWYNGLS